MAKTQKISELATTVYEATEGYYFYKKNDSLEAVMTGRSRLNYSATEAEGVAWAYASEYAPENVRAEVVAEVMKRARAQYLPRRRRTA